MADKKISQLTPATTPVAGTEVFPAVQSGSTVKVAINDLFDRAANFLTVSGANRAPSTYGNLHVASTSDAAAFNGGSLSWGGKSLATGGQYVFGSIKFASDPATVTGWDTYATLSLTNADSSVSEKISFKNNGDLTALSGNFVVGTAGKGIDFSANTHAAGMTSELLDWYETGTWTPSLAGNATYSSRSGRYTRIGNVVHIQGSLQVNVLGTGSTNSISGLPFSAAQRGGGGVTYFASLSQSVVFLSPVAEGSVVTFEGLTAASSTAIDGISIFGNGAYIVFSATYFV